MNRFVILVGCFAVGIMFAEIPADAPGCGIAPRDDEYVSVSDEAALIVWDNVARTEHLIRRATFKGTAYDFGFLVPTPNRPQLEEADGTLFDQLSSLTVAKVIRETREVKEEIEFGCTRREFAANSLADAPSSPAGFVVLEQKRVGDLDAAVLGFKPGAGSPEESAVELLGWLKQNGYAVRLDLIEWITIYARDNWFITAFKVAGTPAIPCG